MTKNEDMPQNWTVIVFCNLLQLNLLLHNSNSFETILKQFNSFVNLQHKYFPMYINSVADTVFFFQNTCAIDGKMNTRICKIVVYEIWMHQNDKFNRLNLYIYQLVSAIVITLTFNTENLGLILGKLNETQCKLTTAKIVP